MTPDIHSLIGPYVLDAVDDIERASFERHLRECDDCRAEAAELREATARLADGTWSVPPPRLRDNVLAAIAETRQVSPAPVVPSRRRAPLRQKLIAAAAVVIAAAGAGSATWAIQDHRVRASQEAVKEQQLVLSAPDLVVREQALTGGGRVTVAYSRLHDEGVIILAADTAPSDGRVYQLWTVRSSRPVSEGALAVGQSTVVKVVSGLPSASDVGVTVEPAGGSASPTLPMVADVKVL